jgi:pSer/pThr/pTyr-binding forkhead associated (FHA) protein
VAWLVVEEGPEIGRRWPVMLGDTSLGRNRSANDIVTPSRTASRRHAVIRADANQCMYYDIEPTNPTLLNDSPVVGSHELVEGDLVRIGDVVLRFTKEEAR